MAGVSAALLRSTEYSRAPSEIWCFTLRLQFLPFAPCVWSNPLEISNCGILVSLSSGVSDFEYGIALGWT